MKMIKLHNCDNIELMKTLPDESIDVICIDPPYLYLKNQKLERVFDEPLFFRECKRLLTKNGFIVMFGRGISFYRWNTLLADLDFTFKEEIVWDKKQASSPLMVLSRVHETVSIFCKGEAAINKVKIPYLEMRNGNVDAIIQDIKRLKSVLNNPKSLNAVLSFLENNNLGYSDKYQGKNKINGVTKDRDRSITCINQIATGMSEKSIIRTDRVYQEKFTKHSVTSDKRERGDRCADTCQSMEFGLTEKSIIQNLRDHYTSIHPTQKPVRLIERLLALVIPNKPRNEIVVADFFGGSMSTMEAVHNMRMQGIATEIDEEYFLAGKERIESLQPVQQKLPI